MDKQMIEEMARDMCGNAYTSVTGDTVCGVLSYGCNFKCKHFARAERLYEAGYRKIPENAVVLTEEEYERWQGQTLNIKKVRKETAEKFAERVKMAFYYEFDELIPSIMADKIDEICKEITEGKDGT